MAESELDSKILLDCEAVVQGMGCEIVEIRTLRGKQGAQVFIVIYQAGGVSIDLCADVLKTLRPRLQMLTDDQDVRIEISSPGLDRVIKGNREFRIFRGRGIRILSQIDNEWVSGILDDVTESGLSLKTGAEIKSFAFSDIRKAKLDDTQEGV
jgi:ribosome maturation factor RimP